MSQQTVSPDVDRAPANVSDKPLLTPRLSPRLALSWPHVLVCGFFAAFFAVLNHLPLYHTDVWGHVLYGREILATNELPQEDPLVPLAEGVKIIDSAWLSQLLFAGVESIGGGEALSLLFALTILSTSLLLGATFYIQTKQRLGLATVGTILVLLFASNRLMAIRPEIIGMLCFAVLILLTTLATRRPWNKNQRPPSLPTERRMLWAVYLGIPIVMIVWANSHGSFPIGVAFLGCHLLGQLVETAWRTWKFRPESPRVAARGLRRWVYLTELAAAAVLINPYGIDAYLNAFTFGGNPNVQDMLEWSAMHAEAAEGIWLAASLVLMLFAFRHSRVVIRPAHVLLLAVFAFATVYSVRMSVWYAFVFGYVFLPHLAELVGRFLPAKPRPANVEAIELGGGVFGRTYIHTLVCGLLIWCGFAFSPVAQPVLGGPAREPERLYRQETPLAVTEYLRKNPPSGLIWNPQWWGDWLLLRGPDELQVFVNTFVVLRGPPNTNAVHVVPPQVWQDYLTVARAEPGWLRIIDKYRVDTIVVDKSQQEDFAAAVRSLPAEWRILYEDRQAVVVTRDEAMLTRLKRKQ